MSSSHRSLRGSRSTADMNSVHNGSDGAYNRRTRGRQPSLSSMSPYKVKMTTAKHYASKTMSAKKSRDAKFQLEYEWDSRFGVAQRSNRGQKEEVIKLGIDQARANLRSAPSASDVGMHNFHLGRFRATDHQLQHQHQHQHQYQHQHSHYQRPYAQHHHHSQRHGNPFRDDVGANVMSVNVSSSENEVDDGGEAIWDTSLPTLNAQHTNNSGSSSNSDSHHKIRYDSVYDGDEQNRYRGSLMDHIFPARHANNHNKSSSNNGSGGGEEGEKPAVVSVASVIDAHIHEPRSLAPFIDIALAPGSSSKGSQTVHNLRMPPSSALFKQKHGKAGQQRPHSQQSFFRSSKSSTGTSRQGQGKGAQLHRQGIYPSCQREHGSNSSRMADIRRRKLNLKERQRRNNKLRMQTTVQFEEDKLVYDNNVNTAYLQKQQPRSSSPEPPISSSTTILSVHADNKSDERAMVRINEDTKNNAKYIDAHNDHHHRSIADSVDIESDYENDFSDVDEGNSDTKNDSAGVIRESIHTHHESESLRSASLAHSQSQPQLSTSMSISSRSHVSIPTPSPSSTTEAMLSSTSPSHAELLASTCTSFSHSLDLFGHRTKASNSDIDEEYYDDADFSAEREENRKHQQGDKEAINTLYANMWDKIQQREQVLRWRRQQRAFQDSMKKVVNGSDKDSTSNIKNGRLDEAGNSTNTRAPMSNTNGSDSDSFISKYMRVPHRPLGNQGEQQQHHQLVPYVKTSSPARSDHSMLVLVTPSSVRKKIGSRSNGRDRNRQESSKHSKNIHSRGTGDSGRSRGRTRRSRSVGRSTHSRGRSREGGRGRIGDSESSFTNHRSRDRIRNRMKDSKKHAEGRDDNHAHSMQMSPYAHNSYYPRMSGMSPYPRHYYSSSSHSPPLISGPMRSSSSPIYPQQHPYPIHSHAMVPSRQPPHHSPLYVQRGPSSPQSMPPPSPMKDRQHHQRAYNDSNQYNVDHEGQHRVPYRYHTHQHPPYPYSFHNNGNASGDDDGMEKWFFSLSAEEKAVVKQRIINGERTQRQQYQDRKDQKNASDDGSSISFHRKNANQPQHAYQHTCQPAQQFLSTRRELVLPFVRQLTGGVLHSVVSDEMRYQHELLRELETEAAAIDEYYGDTEHTYVDKQCDTAKTRVNIDNVEGNPKKNRNDKNNDGKEHEVLQLQRIVTDSKMNPGNQYTSNSGVGGADDEEKVVKIQSLMRKKIAKKEAAIRKTKKREEENIVKVQSLARGRLARKKAAKKKSEEESVIKMQSLARGRIARKTVKDMKKKKTTTTKQQSEDVTKKADHIAVKSNIGDELKVVKIQSLMRGKLARIEIEKVKTEKKNKSKGSDRGAVLQTPQKEGTTDKAGDMQSSSPPILSQSNKAIASIRDCREVAQFNDKDVEKVVKLQSLIRGNNDRRQVEKMQREKKMREKKSREGALEQESRKRQQLMDLAIKGGISVEDAELLFGEEARQGNMVAAYHLAYSYENGEGVPGVDMVKAVKYYSVASTQGHIPSTYNLGVCYKNGVGVQKDTKKAIELYQIAAAAGDADAQFNLGVCHQTGDGVTKDIYEAIELFTKSANQGDPDAQFALGVCYENGDGVQKSEEVAAQLYVAAANQNNNAAKFNVAVFLKNGIAFEKDSERAVNLFSSLAEKGDTEAMFSLAVCYIEGDGVVKDDKKAVELLQRAAAQNHANSAATIRQLHAAQMQVKAQLEARKDSTAEKGGFAVKERPNNSASLAERKIQDTERRKEEAIVVSNGIIDMRDQRRVQEEDGQNDALSSDSAVSNAVSNAITLQPTTDTFQELAEIDALVKEVDVGKVIAIQKLYRGRVDRKKVHHMRAHKRLLDDAPVLLMPDLSTPAKKKKREEKSKAGGNNDDTVEEERGEGEMEDEDEGSSYEEVSVSQSIISVADAEDEYGEKAKAGDVEALYHLAYSYENGEGVTDVDPARAAALYQQAADKGHVHSAYNLAVCCKNGVGVEEDLDKAIMLFKKAAEGGDADAQFNLGVCYQTGDGVKEDIDTAIDLFTKSANQGDPDAQFALGVCYENGDGVVQSFDIAAKLYALSANQGCHAGQFNLAVFLRDGKGVKRDPVHAAQLFTQLADDGDEEAMFALAICYMEGEGVQKDDEMAVKYFKLAAENEHETAIETMKQITLMGVGGL